MVPADHYLHVCVQQKKNVALRARTSSSPAIMAAVWIRGWSATEPRSAPTAQMRATAMNVRTSQRKLRIVFV